ncbi:uncharacterized protein LOC111518368 [Drosophila willistoni]|uniref:uncharacterized protein LOC111518368 n=1 Tax=Drosophila willistoni TaxID=7260 RepID=UPI001F071E73|nr:uncharacterized protein LOC111518368 [Drosophila willistoni]
MSIFEKVLDLFESQNRAVNSHLRLQQTIMTNILASQKGITIASNPQQQPLTANTLRSQCSNIEKNGQQQPNKANTLSCQKVMTISKDKPVMANTLGSQGKTLVIDENRQKKCLMSDTSGSQIVMKIAKNEPEQALMAKSLSYQLSVINENGQYKGALVPIASSTIDNKENILPRIITLEEVFQRLQRESLHRCCLCGTAIYKKDRLEHLYMCCLQISGGLYTLRCDICNVFRCVYKSHLSSHQKSCTNVKFLPLRALLNKVLKGGKEGAFVAGIISSIEAKGPRVTVDIVKKKFDRKMKIACKENL